MSKNNRDTDLYINHLKADADSGTYAAFTDSVDNFELAFGAEYDCCHFTGNIYQITILAMPTEYLDIINYIYPCRLNGISFIDDTQCIEDCPSG